MATDGSACAPEETALLRLEEAFAASLAQVDNLLFRPLLEAGSPDAADPKEPEHVQLLRELCERHRAVQQLTEAGLRGLKRRLHHPEAGGLDGLLVLRETPLFLDAYVRYFEAFTDCVVLQCFQWAAKKKSLACGSCLDALRPLLPPAPAQAANALRHVLLQPAVDHLHRYVPALLSLSIALPQGDPGRELVAQAAQQFGNLQTYLAQALDDASATQALWKTLGPKLADPLCVPARRLLLDGRDAPVAASVARCDRVLLFDDVLVLLQGHNFQMFDLKLVWVDDAPADGEDPDSDRLTLQIITAEGNFLLSTKEPQSRALWRWKLRQAVGKVLSAQRGSPVAAGGWGPGRPVEAPPATRWGVHTFRAAGRLQRATYDGQWHWGRPHGKGTLKWPDGTNHVGDFQAGLEHGFGIRLVPRGPEDEFDCYKGHWQDGQMQGYGICEYGNGLVYKGYFLAGQRHGFGVLESAPPDDGPFRYTGHWARDRKEGYGVWDDQDRGERYIGTWQDDHRHGQGVVVTQSGTCYQRTFNAGQMAGKVTFPNGFTLEGSFGGKAPGSGLHTQGVLDTGAHLPDDRLIRKRQLGVSEFPAETRWPGVFGPFLDFVRAGGPAGTEEASMGFHVHGAKEPRPTARRPLVGSQRPCQDSSRRRGGGEDRRRPGGDPATPGARGAARLPGQGPAVGGAPAGQAAGHPDAGLPGHLRRRWCQQAPPGHGSGRGEGLCPARLAAVPGTAGPRPGAAGPEPGGGPRGRGGRGAPGTGGGAAPGAPALPPGLVPAVPAVPRAGGRALRAGHRPPQPLPRRQAPPVPPHPEKTVASGGPHPVGRSETVPRQGQVLPLGHGVSAEDHSCYKHIQREDSGLHRVPALRSPRGARSSSSSSSSS
ncbi:ALS2 C-terminal-like protein isoform X4 [Tachyglossus aculeatus]|uniref:ALS2 C-terminal-like protein isoform X4 n=1 Tax=Tachyglossus aculeatus TaxID=9261 RepID=UPI0018F27D3A|nr:ALS2 C-terminal-like protein isoform X4 [Tachyglossus aculeatus]